MTDVRKYLAGELSAREMHDLEKAALDDPFLTDALEGLALRADPLDHDLTELKARLDARVNEKKKHRVVPLWMRVAAAVILLVGLGTTVYYTQQGKSKLNVDIEQQPAAVAKTAPPPVATSPASPGTPPTAAAPPPATADVPPARVTTPLIESDKTPAIASATHPANATLPAAPPLVTDKLKNTDSLLANSNAGSVSKPDVSVEYRSKPADTISAAEGYAAIPGLRTDTTQYSSVFKRADQSFARARTLRLPHVPGVFRPRPRRRQPAIGRSFGLSQRQQERFPHRRRWKV